MMSYLRFRFPRLVLLGSLLAWLASTALPVAHACPHPIPLVEQYNVDATYKYDNRNSDMYGQAASFRTASASVIGGLGAQIYEIGMHLAVESPGALCNIDIYKNVNGFPGLAPIGNVVKNFAPNLPGIQRFVPAKPIILQPDTTYWLVLTTVNPGDMMAWTASGHDYTFSNGYGATTYSGLAIQPTPGGLWGYSPGNAYYLFDIDVCPVSPSPSHSRSPSRSKSKSRSPSKKKTG